MTRDDSNTYDALVIGSGLAGILYSYFLAELGHRVAVIGSTKISGSNSYWAQGGIIYQEEDAFQPQISSLTTECLVKDILSASDQTSSPAAAQQLAEIGSKLIQEYFIQKFQVNFDVHQDQSLQKTREGGHSEARIIFAKDQTGRALIESAYQSIHGHKNITFLHEHTAVDLITLAHNSTRHQDRYAPSTCVGAFVINHTLQNVVPFFAHKTILATGGLGQIFKHTTNQQGIVGGGIAMAHRVGARVMDLEYIQFHPTVFHKKGSPRFLISEAMRGEGAVLVNRKGEEFLKKIHPLGSLAPRSVVARAIYYELMQSGEDCVYLDASKLTENAKERFPFIFERCLVEGIRVLEDPIPITPAAHYLCGGVYTDLNGRTSVRNLNAIGETACTGLHGANRLASTSLLECLVGAHQTATADATDLRSDAFSAPEINPWKDGSQEADEVLLLQDLNLIKETMWNYVGLVRSQERLVRAHKILRELREEVEEFYRDCKLSPKLIELRNSVQVASMVVHAARLNRKSSGCHYLE